MIQTPGENDSVFPEEGVAAFDQIATQEHDSRSQSPLPIAVDDGKYLVINFSY